MDQAKNMQNVITPMKANVDSTNIQNILKRTKPATAPETNIVNDLPKPP